MLRCAKAHSAELEENPIHSATLDSFNKEQEMANFDIFCSFILSNRIGVFSYIYRGQKIIGLVSN